MSKRPALIIIQVPGSGTTEICRFMVPVLVPAVARETCVPIVSENGFAVAANEPNVSAEYMVPVRGPRAPSRFADENWNSVLLVPPQARLVTVPLAPEFVPPKYHDRGRPNCHRQVIRSTHAPSIVSLVLSGNPAVDRRAPAGGIAARSHGRRPC